MLLRRITQHVKDQNWFAVFVDFFIVVVGVFIGLQVQEWAIEQERKKDEVAYLERLNDETKQLIELRKQYDEIRPLIISIATKAYQKIFSDDEVITFTDQECRSVIWTSEKFRTIPPSELPTITELLASGRLETISSESLRIEILNYIQEVNKARDYIYVTQGKKSSITEKYSEMFTLTIKDLDNFTKNDGINLEAQCDVEKMRNNHNFRNSLTKNLDFYQSYYRRGIKPLSQKLAELSEAIDIELDTVKKVGEQ